MPLGLLECLCVCWPGLQTIALPLDRSRGTRPKGRFTPTEKKHNKMRQKKLLFLISLLTSCLGTYPGWMFDVSLYCECLMSQTWIFNVAKLGGCAYSGWMFNVSASGTHSFHLWELLLHQELSWNWIYNFAKPAPEMKPDTKLDQRFATRLQVSQESDIWCCQKQYLLGENFIQIYQTHTHQAFSQKMGGFATVKAQKQQEKNILEF